MKYLLRRELREILAKKFNVESSWFSNQFHKIYTKNHLFDDVQPETFIPRLASALQEENVSEILLFGENVNDPENVGQLVLSPEELIYFARVLHPKDVVTQYYIMDTKYCWVVTLTHEGMAMISGSAAFVRKLETRLQLKKSR